MTDRAAWKALFDAHWEFILRTVRRFGGPSIDAEEVAQEVLVVVWRRLPDFEGRSALRTWLYRICLNVASEHRRRQRRRQALSSFLKPLGFAPPPDEQVHARAALGQVHALLEKLSPKRRDAFVLCELEGLSAEEAAQVLGIPVATVRTRVFHARQDFLKLMGESKP